MDTKHVCYGMGAVVPQGTRSEENRATPEPEPHQSESSLRSREPRAIVALATQAASQAWMDDPELREAVEDYDKHLELAQAYDLASQQHEGPAGAMACGALTVIPTAALLLVFALSGKATTGLMIGLGAPAGLGAVLFALGAYKSAKVSWPADPQPNRMSMAIRFLRAMQAYEAFNAARTERQLKERTVEALEPESEEQAPVRIHPPPEGSRQDLQDLGLTARAGVAAGVDEEIGS